MNSSTTRKSILIRAGHSDLSGVYAKPSSAPRALIVALHGSSNSAAIFDNTIPGEAGFLDTAASLGYAALALDRPGYGTSQQIAEELSTLDGQITLLRLALTAAWEQYGADSADIVLLGQSFGGHIVLGLAGCQPDVPLLGVSTHGTGLRWLPGALQRFQRLLSDAPWVEFPFDENARSRGPANSWVHEARERLKQSQAPLPMAELREVLRFPKHLRQISAEVHVPVQMTLGEYDTIWESSASALDELSQLFPQAPFVDVRRQRFIPHQPSAHLLEDQPALPGYDQDAEVRKQDYQHADPKVLYERLQQLCERFADLITSLPSSTLQRTGIHSEYGPMTLQQCIEAPLGSVPEHLAQLRAAQEEPRSAK